MKTFWEYKKAATYGAIIGLAYNLLQLVMHGGLGMIGHAIGYLIGGAIAGAILALIIAAIRNQIVTGSFKPSVVTSTRDFNDTTPTSL